jgi:hypothetical protein
VLARVDPRLLETRIAGCTLRPEFVGEAASANLVEHLAHAIANALVNDAPPAEKCS